MSTHDNIARQHYAFGPYEIIETVGIGGMGVVYRAMDTALHRTVALKILRDDLRAQAHIVARFQREAEATAALDHPNIVHIYSVGSVGRIPYISMEFIEGQTLGEMIRDHGRLPWQEALTIGRQIAEALGCAHAAQIIHRDIKPGNILVHADGRVKVTDFGIAKVMTAASKLTVDGSRLGTPQYMCPERCANRPITPASDLYSLGVVLFQTITGRLPHEANTPVELVRKITSEDAARVRDFLPDLPEDVDRLIAYLLDRDPRHRPQQAKEVAAAIERVLAGQPLDTQPASAALALAAYRDTIATPTPTPTTQTRTPAPRRRPADIWFSVPRQYRIAGAVLIAAALLALGITWLSAWIAQGEALATPRIAAVEATWTQTRPLAEFRTEAPGLLRVRLALPDFHVQSVQDAAEQGIIVLCGGKTATPRAGQSAIVALDPAMHTAALLLPPVPTPLRLRGHDTTGIFLETPQGPAQLPWNAARPPKYTAETPPPEQAPAPQSPTLEIAEDYGGRLQLWQAATPHQPRKQLTFLDSGIAPHCTLSNNGAYAVCALPEDASLIIAQLRE
jgi:hypothetical protein